VGYLARGPAPMCGVSSLNKAATARSSVSPRTQPWLSAMA